MVTRNSPEQPPEAALIKEALKRSRLSGREAARRAGISDARWRQIVNGYQVVSGHQVPVRAPDETLARMAHAAGVAADDLRAAGRPEAADLLAALEGPPSPQSAPGAHPSDPHLEAIAALLATLSPEAQDEVLRRVGLAEPAAHREESPGPERTRRAG